MVDIIEPTREEFTRIFRDQRTIRAFEELFSNLNTANVNIADIKIDITNIQGDISGIQGDIIIIQNNITTIENDITDIQGQLIDNRIVVKESSQFSGDLDPSKEYFIDGKIDMGSLEITVPTSGLNLNGTNFDNSGLYSSSDNYTMFKSPSGGAAAGFLRGQNIFLNASGTNSKLFDLDNQGNNNSVEFTNCNIGQFGYAPTTSMGNLKDYRLFRLDGCAVILCADGLTCDGTMSGITVSDTIALALPATHTLFKEGTSLSLTGSFSSNMNFNSVNSATEFCNFQASNFVQDSGFKLSTFRTTAANPIPNILSSNNKARFVNCLGIEDTYIGGEWVLTTEVTTTISTAGVYVKLEGNTTYSDMQHLTNTTDNAFVYDADETILVNVDCVIGISGGMNDQVRIKIRQWDDSASAFIDIATSSAQTLSGGLLGTRAENINIFGIATLDLNDRIEIWVANISDTSNVVGLEFSKTKITERA